MWLFKKNKKKYDTLLRRQILMEEINEQSKMNEQYKRGVRESEMFFDVPGAGEIAISNNASARTGSGVGFSFGVSWGRYGFSGGVLPRTEAKKLAEHILKTLSECTETEGQIILKDQEYFRSL